MTRLRILTALVLTAILASAGTATAGKLITGKDIRNGSVAERDLSAGVRTKLANSGKPGPVGATGERGATGATGIQGPAGPQGQNGVNGSNGTNGSNGRDGDDAYEVAVANGFNGSRAQWLVSLKGEKGDPCPSTNDACRGPQGDQGPAGPGAYQHRTGTVQVGDTATLDCPNGDTPISGGFNIVDDNAATPFSVVSSQPVDSNVAQGAWQVTVSTPEPVVIQLVVYCVPNV